MNFITLDFETYWDKQHTLSKMNFADYVLHPKTQIISCAIKSSPTASTYVAWGEAACRQAFATLSWDDSIVIGHNMAEFDAAVLAWRFGVRPRMWGDTLCMARPWHDRVSLATLVEHYQLGVKDKRILHQTQGRRLEQFSSDERADMARYNIADTEQCWALFRKLAARLPTSELMLIDATIRMIVEPRFVADVPLLESAHQTELAERAQRLQIVAQALWPELPLEEGEEQARKTCGSSPKLKLALEALGVDPPTKYNAKGKEIPAFAKTDEVFTALLDHEDAAVRALVSARIGLKSNLVETRSASLIKMARHMKGVVPNPLRYHKTLTGRWGGFIYNTQNLPRVQGGANADALRNALCAPPGHVVIVADFSSVELRVNHTLWQEECSMALFASDPEKADLYKAFAASLYGVPVSEITPDQRRVGKIAQLQLGYGSGASKFRIMAKRIGGVDLTEADAKRVVSVWRETYQNIYRGWYRCQDAISAVLNSQVMQLDPWGLSVATAGGITLATGRMIRYPNLFTQPDEQGRLQYFYGAFAFQKIYGAKIVENIVQALARDVLRDAVVRLIQETGRYPVHLAHDEIVCIEPEGTADQLLADLLGIMRAAPVWWPALRLWAEGGMAETYGAAK